MTDNDDSKPIEWLRQDVKEISDVLGGVSEKVTRMSTLFDVHLAGHERRGGRWWTFVFQVTGWSVTSVGAVLLALAAAGKWPW